MTAGPILPGASHSDCARAYAEMGWALVPIPSGQKRPTRPGWNRPGGYVTDPDLAAQTWAAGQNMGVVLGPSGLATLDVDSPEHARIALAAVGIDLDARLADAVRIIGNPAKAKALYRVPAESDLSTKKLVWPASEPDGKAFVVFELRHGPVQDVLPPSTHPETKRPYEWGHAFWTNGGIPALPDNLLKLWREWPAMLAIMEQACPWAHRPAPLPAVPSSASPPPADRGEELPIDLIGIALDRCERLGAMRWRATDENHLTHEERIAVVDYARAFDGGLEWALDAVFRHLSDYDEGYTRYQFSKTTGNPPLCSTLCPAGQCESIRAIGGRSPIKFVHAARREAGTRAKSPTPMKEEHLVFPDVMTGAAGAFAKLYAAHLEAPAHFFYMAYLTCLGAVVADRLTIRSELAPQPRLYTLLLGESADDRKSTAVSKTADHFRQANVGLSVCWGVGSAEGLQKRMEETPNLLLALDEMKQFVSKCKIESSVLLPCVTTLFEATRYESHTKHTAVCLEQAHLSILAASTISTYENTWSSQFTDIGFNNRLWLVPGGAARRFSIPVKVKELDRFLAQQELAKVIAHVGNRLELEITPEARALFHEWYLALPRSVYSKRLDGYALRLMALLAANDLKDEVDADTVRQVIELGNHQFKVRQAYDPVDADNQTAKLEQKIRRVLTARGALTDRDLKRFVHANQKGLWIYSSAKQNLQRAEELDYDKKTKLFFLTREAT